MLRALFPWLGSAIPVVGGGGVGIGVYIAFKNLGHIAISSRNWEESPYSLRVVPMGLSVAEVPQTELGFMSLLTT